MNERQLAHPNQHKTIKPNPSMEILQTQKNNRKVNLHLLVVARRTALKRRKKLNRSRQPSHQLRLKQRKRMQNQKKAAVDRAAAQMTIKRRKSLEMTRKGKLRKETVPAALVQAALKIKRKKHLQRRGHQQKGSPRENQNQAVAALAAAAPAAQVPEVATQAPVQTVVQVVMKR
jgi:hypothetical protein